MAAKAGDDEILAQLERSPQGANVGDLLAQVARQVETAIKTDRLERALKMLATVVRLETKVADAPRRTYGIALKRMFNKPLLQGIAHLLDYPAQREDGALVLQRAGEDGVEVLLDILVAAPTVLERRGAFDALTRMKQGTDQLVHMLSHPQWFVVRNIAELVGELGLEDAVPALAKQVSHEDERVRKAVALALAKIATPTCAEPLRRALRDKSQVVRLQVALGIGGRKSAALAMPLVVAMSEEKDPEVERELILALGRIGSPDAVQALIKFAQPSGKLFGRTPTVLRVAAVEALRLAATPAAVGTLQGLSGDSDRQVKAAAQAAVVELNKKKA
jgi:HEAT repeat protein